MLEKSKKLSIKAAFLATAAMGIFMFTAAPQVYAQNAAQNQAAIFQMQEQLRLLNGRVEELTFQVLELQELLRQTRETNESRFLELEQGGSGQDDFDTNGDSFSSVESAPDAPEQTATLEEQNTLPTDGVAVDAALADGLGRPLDLSAPPFELSAVNENLLADTIDGAQSAAGLPSAAELYQSGYSLVMSGNYAAAEKDFRQLVKSYPDAEQVADANYWLGESLFAQGDFNDAAEAYLNVVNKHPGANLAPDAMLKLGVALIGMGQTSVACDTFDEVESRYPETPNFFKQRLQREKSSASCI